MVKISLEKEFSMKREKYSNLKDFHRIFPIFLIF